MVTRVASPEVNCYAFGMTMKRTAKKTHATELLVAAATGYTLEEFAAPKLRSAARADRGHCRMTAEEYRVRRLHRGSMNEMALETVIELRAQLKSARRVLGGRLVHPPRRGYINSSYEVQRCIHAR